MARYHGVKNVLLVAYASVKKRATTCAFSPLPRHVRPNKRPIHAMAIAPKTQSALIGGDNGEIVLSQAVPVPPQELEDLQVGVEVRAIALNPVDTKMVGGYLTPGAVSGCEFAGVVTGLGPVAARDRGLKIGDRVAGVVMGMNPLRPQIGAFAQYTASSAYGTVKNSPRLEFRKSRRWCRRCCLGYRALGSVPQPWSAVRPGARAIEYPDASS